MLSITASDYFGIFILILGRVAEPDLPLPLLLFSVMLETSGLVVVESQPMLGTRLYYLGRLSG